jgi:NAD(P)-dependent dehydrogenase (short-subunit alcohol dehydrogenase family)
MSSLKNRIALVTGATRGIGRAIALELARRGAHVIATGRTQGALEELDDEIRKLGGEATLAPCDLKDYAALDRLGLAIHERWRKLDILVGNAGILGPVSPLAHVDPPKWEETFAINVTANWRLIRSMDELLRASDAGRAVFVTSGAGSKAEMTPYMGPYATSKAALDALARTYAAETANTSLVRVMVANPGPLRTRMRATLMPGEDPATLQTPDGFAARVADLCAPEWEQTGKFYEYRTDSVKSFREPA